ncbi:MAG: phage major capsid protein [Smithella sp.]
MNPYQKRMDEAFQKMAEIRKTAEKEKRSLTAEEMEQRALLKAEIEAAKREWDDFKAEEELRGELYGQGGGAMTIEDNAKIEIPDQPIYRGSPATMLGMQLMDIRSIYRHSPDPAEYRDAKSRLEKVCKRCEELAEVNAKKKGETRAAATGGFTVGVEGGQFLQGETASELMTHGFNNSAILPKTSKRTLSANTQFLEIDGIDETSRKAGSRGGGVRIYTNKELGEFTASKIKFNKVKIQPEKLTGLYVMSGEMTRNVTFLGQEMRSLFGEEYAFKWQDMLFNGSGAGEGLGVKNSPAFIQVPKETGQKAKTILSKNLSKMWARYSGRKEDAIWVVNRDTNVELDELSIPAGTGALEPRFISYGSDGILRIKGAPVVEIEQAETLGTVGDIMLVDCSQIITADKGDIMEASSIHVEFVYDQEMFRFIHYFDCQPRWLAPIIPFKGSDSVSFAVGLATRA